MKRTKIKCEICGQEISKSNYTKHLRRHKLHPETFKKKVSYKLTHDGLTCQYCGKLCKNRKSLCNHERLCKANPNKQLILYVPIENFNSKGRQAWNKGLTKATDERVKQQSTNLKKYYKTHVGPRLGKTQTSSTKLKIANSIKNYLIKHPDKVPYLLNHSSKKSYPERYFEELFRIEQIDLKYHKQVGRYELDFYNEEKLLDIEIDGEQHYLDSKIIQHDKERTLYLNNLGWKVFRIRWSEFKKLTLLEKSNVISKIKELL